MVRCSHYALATGPPYTAHRAGQTRELVTGGRVGRFRRGESRAHCGREGGAMTTILFIIAAILVIAGIVQIVRGGLLFGIILIVVGLLVGPGGYSIFK
jgi:hypothetical protein